MEFDLLDGSASEMAVELGLSIWMRRADADLASVRLSLLQVRGPLVEAGGLDPTTEPVPFCGLSDRTDVVNLAAYVGDLVQRASSSAGHCAAALCDRVIDQLAEAPSPVGGLRLFAAPHPA